MTTEFLSDTTSVTDGDTTAPGSEAFGISPASLEAGTPFEDGHDFIIESRGSGAIPLLADGLALVVAAVEAAVLEGTVHTVHTHGVLAIAFSTMILRLLASVPFLVMILCASHSRFHMRRSLGTHLGDVAPLLAVGALLCIAGWHIAQAFNLLMPPPDSAVLLMCAIGLITVTAARMAHRAPPIDERGGRTRRLVVVGSGVVAQRLSETLLAEGGVDVIGFVDDEPMDSTGCLGKLSYLAACCEAYDVDHVIVAFSRSSSEDIIDALRPIQGRLPITVVPRLFEILPGNASLHELASGIPGIGVPTAALGSVPRFVKRSMDFLGAGGALVVISPLLAAVALAVRLTSPGPVLYRQERVGHRGKTFDILKFRSMTVEQKIDHPSMLAGETTVGPFPKLKNDPRVTTVGRFIRRTSLDELPQLWNVVCGHMSLVGPRPFMARDAAFIDGWARRRYSVRPGITGLWQVSGRNNLTFSEMCRLDSLYVTSWSVGLDLRILVRTLRAVVNSTGAF